MQLDLHNGFYMVTFTSEHSYKVGDKLKVHGAIPASLNGSFTVHSVQSTTMIVRRRRWWDGIYYWFKRIMTRLIGVKP